MAAQLVYLYESYQFNDKDQPSRVVTINRLHVLGDDIIDTERERGVYRFEVPLSPDLVAKLDQVPGWYELRFTDRPDRKTGRPERRLTGLEYVAPADGFGG